MNTVSDLTSEVQAFSRNEPTDWYSQQNDPEVTAFGQACAAGKFGEVVNFVRSRPRPAEALQYGLWMAFTRLQSSIIDFLLSNETQLTAEVPSLAAAWAKRQPKIWRPAFDALLKHGWDVNAPK